jgi:molybdopterin-guanine dinucleotide biosynthesis protein A
VGDVLGAVLTGGQSTRMGQDKAVLLVNGAPMAVTVAGVLEASGATRVVAVGGDAVALRALGLDVVPDPRQGDGPLAGISAALHAGAGFDAVAVLACDLIDASPAGVRQVVDALDAVPGADVAVPVVGGQREPLHAVWRPAAVTVVDRALDAGERAVHAVFDRLTTVEVLDLDPAWFRNVNSPQQLGHT